MSFSAGLVDAAKKPKPAGNTEPPALAPPPKTTTPPAAATLPTNEPAQTGSTNKTITRADMVARQAMLGSSPSKLVSTLVAWRANGEEGAAKIEQFARAMASNLGMSVEDAMLIANAMSRGGLDAKNLAAGINALRTMPAAERANWMARWLPIARAGARALNQLGDDAVQRALGANDEIVEALVALAGETVLMVDRNAVLKGDATLEGRADQARESTRTRLTQARSAALLAEAGQIGVGDEGDMALRDDFAEDLAARYGISVELAVQIVDAMRNKTQAGRLIADGMAELEHAGGAGGAYGPSFFDTVQRALANEAAIAADPFKRELGISDPSEVADIMNLARFVDSLEDYVDLLEQRAAAAG